MDVHELKHKFFQRREYETDNVNDLLDFAKNAYISNEISISEYRNLVRELEAQGAEIPTDDIDHSLIEN
jgi:hypothetical protein